MNAFECPTPMPATATILLGHGSGGKLSAELLRDVFLPALGNPILSRLEDQAMVSVDGVRLAFTTDSFVVRPLFFPGGDIGSLAVHGTINDLAVGGASPLFLSAAFILEEGFPVGDLKRIVESMARAAADAGVPIVTGDTKVVEKGHGDGVYINTTGIGVVRGGLDLSVSHAQPGDAILLSGTIGDHGVCILAQRDGLELGGVVPSDSAPLHTLVEALLSATDDVRTMRDPTRGGLAATLNEIAAQSRVGIIIEERAIPVKEPVHGACELLGLDPLHIANEGKLVAVVASAAADRALAAMRAHSLGHDAAVIGTVTSIDPGWVRMKTRFGTTRVVSMLAGDQLPRIC